MNGVTTCSMVSLSRVEVSPKPLPILNGNRPTQDEGSEFPALSEGCALGVLRIQEASLHDLEALEVLGLHDLPP